jgi:hypothetical protein
MGVLSFGSGSSFLTGITIRPGIDAWNAQKLNFGPQVGFNWSPTASNGKVVFRGGYGLNYNQQQIATANANDNNPPGTTIVPGTSKGPTQINPNILYAASSSPTDINGYPPNPTAKNTFNSAGLPTGGGANLNALPGNLPTEYSHHYSLDMELDLGHSVVANVGYVGSSTHHTLYNLDSNALGQLMGAPQNPLVNSINTFGSGGKSNNNMLLAGLKHQFSHTFSADAQFTWAHSLDTDSGPYNRDAYLYNPKFSYGRSDFDVNTSFKAFGLWQPVLFHGGHAWVEKVVGGWSISGIFTFQTGYGWTPVFNTGSNQIYCNTCNYSGQSLRPFYNGTALHSTSSNAFKTGSNFPNPGTANTGTSNNEFINNYFTIPNYSDAITNNPGQTTTNVIPPPGIGRNSFPGPGYRNVDFTIAKAFGLPKMRVLGEDAKFEIKANMFNALNLLNINPSSLSTNIANSNLGQASSALGSRTIDLQARFSF